MHLAVATIKCPRLCPLIAQRFEAGAILKPAQGDIFALSVDLLNMSLCCHSFLQGNRRCRKNANCRPNSTVHRCVIRPLKQSMDGLRHDCRDAKFLGTPMPRLSSGRLLDWRPTDAMSPHPPAFRSQGTGNASACCLKRP